MIKYIKKGISILLISVLMISNIAYAKDFETNIYSESKNSTENILDESSGNIISEEDEEKKNECDETLETSEDEKIEDDSVNQTDNKETGMQQDENAESEIADEREELPQITYRAHVQSIGWQEWVGDNEIAGTIGKGLRIEAIQIKLLDENGNLSERFLVEYRVHVQSLGWQEWISNGETAGTTGRSLRIEAIQIRIKDIVSGEILNTVQYRTHIQSFGWLPYGKNEMIAGTTGFAKRMEAVQISMKNENLLEGKSYVRAYSSEEFMVNAHIQSIGNINAVRSGEILGTTGRGLRMEGLTINLDQSSHEVCDGTIEYRGHVQNIGWMDPVTNHEYCGTTGQSKRIEAISIKLTGEIEKYYDIYYRVHVQKCGWLGWAKNGQDAGTTGMAYRLEAIQIKLVVKGTTVPDENANYYKDQADFIQQIRKYEGCRYVFGGGVHLMVGIALDV